MNTMTLTTSSFFPTLHQTLRSEETLSIKYSYACSILKEISNQYTRENDSLSINLKAWIKNFETVIDRENPISLEEVAQILKREFIDLEEKFQNPLAPDRFIEVPFFDGSYIWDQKTLEDYQTLSKFSPFDSKPVTEARYHPFCHKMIAWWQCFPLETLRKIGRSEERGIVLHSPLLFSPPIQTISSQNNEIKYSLYLAYAERYLFKNKTIQQNKMMQALIIKSRENLIRSEQASQQFASLIQKSNQAHREEMNMRISAVEETQEGTNRVFRGIIKDQDGKIEHLEEKQKIAEKKIEDLEVKDKENKAQIARQAAHISNLEQRVQNSSSNEGCTLF